MTPEDVLSYWFGPVDHPAYPQTKNATWWGKSAATDRHIRERYGETLAGIGRGEVDWTDTPRGLLAQVIVLDQFSRNMHRGQPGMYALDHLAQDLALRGIEVEDALTLTERRFIYMPLMHAEDVALQRLCVQKAQQMLDAAGEGDRAMCTSNLHYAKQHAAIVERFGRFPHRNGILGRTSTDEELAFLKQPGSSF